MFDRKIVVHTLEMINGSLSVITQRVVVIKSVDDFLLSNEGMMLLDSVCMKLIAIGESVKSLDKITNKEFLCNYPEIPWKFVMGVRDIIVHHYFDIDANEIFRICKDDIPVLQKVINQMIEDLHP